MSTHAAVARQAFTRVCRGATDVHALLVALLELEREREIDLSGATVELRAALRHLEHARTGLYEAMKHLNRTEET